MCPPALVVSELNSPALAWPGRAAGAGDHHTHLRILQSVNRQQIIADQLLAECQDLHQDVLFEARAIAQISTPLL